MTLQQEYTYVQFLRDYTIMFESRVVIMKYTRYQTCNPKRSYNAILVTIRKSNHVITLNLFF